eukprot:148794-Pelagomonas_calceolata.AAC.2
MGFRECLATGVQLINKVEGFCTGLQRVDCVSGAIYTPHALELLKELDTHTATKLALKLHAHSVHMPIKILAPDALENTPLNFITKIRHGLLLVTLLIPIVFIILPL